RGVSARGRGWFRPAPTPIVPTQKPMAKNLALRGLAHPFKFVSKTSLFRLPAVGQTMRMCRYVSLRRESTSSMRQMMATCRAWLRRGMPVMIFPESTYGPGGRLLPFKKGAFALAVETRVPVVPVVIEGTPDLVHEDGPWLNP